MMEDTDFEFPPDHLNGGANVQRHNHNIDDTDFLDLMSTPQLQHHQRMHVPAQSIPLSVLSQTPVENLPPTHIPGVERLSIRQLMRGTMRRHHHGRHQVESSGPFSAISGTALIVSQPAAAGDTFVSGVPLSISMKPSPQQQFFSHFGGTPDVSPAATQSGVTRLDGTVELFEQLPAAVATRDQSAISGIAVDVLHGNTSSGAVPREGQWEGRKFSRAEWTENESRKFYQALSQYGTDFTAISVLYPGRTRDDIKRLYHRELRKHAGDVRRALQKAEDIDIEAFNSLLAERKKHEEPPKKTLNREEEELLRMMEQDNETPNVSTTSGSSDAHGTAAMSKSELASGSHFNEDYDDFDMDDVPLDVLMAAPELESATASSKKNSRSRAVKTATGKTPKMAVLDAPHSTPSALKRRRGSKEDDEALVTNMKGEDETILEMVRRQQREEDLPLADAAMLGVFGSFDVDSGANDEFSFQ